ncbi:conserved Plasmodium protein, unknown function [Plasmodium sp. DRC-Itaito]|uniref:Uncharacterized protein n=1 Tax=Plasmodium gaboni TaxID=647221 RepID=A0ABY1UTF8_9APIC|nr:conserved Plasmodium protein, unknown function [Plasmodium gaboni]SOV24923.1 conserved Plasmodium protein, unknown function [Plasmodium sp. DRC-Itaito]
MSQTNKQNDNKKNKITRESLLDDQFSENPSSKFVLNKEEKKEEEINPNISQQKVNKKKPLIDRSLIGQFSVEKYKSFLSKIEKSNEDIKNKDAESVRIDKDILDSECYNNNNNNESCVLMDVSVGIYDVCNENISDDKLRDMNITIAEVKNQDEDEQDGKDLIQEI